MIPVLFIVSTRSPDRPDDKPSPCAVTLVSRPRVLAAVRPHEAIIRATSRRQLASRSRARAPFVLQAASVRPLEAIIRATSRRQLASRSHVRRFYLLSPSGSRGANTRLVPHARPHAHSRIRAHAEPPLTHSFSLSPPSCAFAFPSGTRTRIGRQTPSNSLRGLTVFATRVCFRHHFAHKILVASTERPTMRLLRP